MPLLNDPIDYEDRSNEPDWSPEIGFRRALLHGAVASAALAVLLAPLAAFTPYVILPWILRTPLTFGVAWLLFVFIERAAGYMSASIIGLGLAFTLVTLCSNHLFLALNNVHGAGMAEEWWIFPANLTESMLGGRDSKEIGWGWMHPYVLASMNVIPVLVGGGFCAALKTRG